MKKDLELQLVTEFPTFFKDIYGDPKKTCMHWGVAFGEGWFDLFHRLCVQLKKIVAPEFHFTQLKEKYGLMTIYSKGGNKQIYDLIEEYCDLSSMVCEQCGSEGEDVTTAGHGRIQTLCNGCRGNSTRRNHRR